jgi:hypothetical protein
MLLVIFLTGCQAADTSSQTSAPENLTPVETVKYYFQEWGNKNQTGMESVVYEKMQGGDDGFDGQISIKLKECWEVKDESWIKEGFEGTWYDKEPYQIALVEAVFDVKYTSDANTGFSNGEYQYDYWLVKDSEDADWIIIQCGMG